MEKRFKIAKTTNSLNLISNRWSFDESGRRVEVSSISHIFLSKFRFLNVFGKVKILHIIMKILKRLTASQWN